VCLPIKGRSCLSDLTRRDEGNYNSQGPAGRKKTGYKDRNWNLILRSVSLVRIRDSHSRFEVGVQGGGKDL